MKILVTIDTLDFVYLSCPFITFFWFGFPNLFLQKRIYCIRISNLFEVLANFFFRRRRTLFIWVFKIVLSLLLFFMLFFIEFFELQDFFCCKTFLLFLRLNQLFLSRFIVYWLLLYYRICCWLKLIEILIHLFCLFLHFFLLL
jgi:hypothetical protein